MKKPHGSRSNLKVTNISLPWIDGWLAFENGEDFTPSAEYSSDSFFDYINGYEANLKATAKRGGFPSGIFLNYSDVLSSWSIAGRRARFLNMGGEPPITISAPEKQQWKTGYRLASDAITSRGSI